MRNYSTRKPTGRPAWPLILLAGIEGGGKSWAAVEATGLPTVGRAFYLELGERMADEYGNVPGANFEIVEHNGTFNDLLGAAQWCARQPVEDEKFNILIIDSISAVWELLSDEAQLRANTRGRGRKNNDGDRQITMDLWNDAKDRYMAFMQVLRTFQGVVIATARLDSINVVVDGSPTGERQWKPRGHKNLPFDVQVIVQARQPRKWVLTKIASTQFQLPVGGELELPEFSVGKLLEKMGINAGTTTATYVRPSAASEPALPSDVLATIERLESNGDVEGLKQLWKVVNAHGREDYTQLVVEAGQRVAAGNTARELDNSAVLVAQELGGELAA